MNLGVIGSENGASDAVVGTHLTPPLPQPPVRHGFPGPDLSVHWNTLRIPMDPSWASLEARPGCVFGVCECGCFLCLRACVLFVGLQKIWDPDVWSPEALQRLPRAGHLEAPRMLVQVTNFIETFLFFVDGHKVEIICGFLNQWVRARVPSLSRAKSEKIFF